jgi:hypothetical protein
MSSRIYNKLYVSKNREEGSEKIFLGYQGNSTEVSLQKDAETYFHIPSYTSSVILSSSSLIIDGATGGPFPAASDRIYQNKQNYGNTTNKGTPTEVPDGTWFCSWLYSNPDTKKYEWYDRYFYSNVKDEEITTTQYYNNVNYILNTLPNFTNIPVVSSTDLNIFDLPSTLVLEPTVLYKYFHIGESTAQQLVSSFAGVSGQYNLFDINNWQSQQAFGYTQSYPIVIDTNAPFTSIFPSTTDTQILLSSVLNFNTTYDQSVYLDWNPNYIPTNDFTLIGWVQSGDWNSCPSTQMFGNYTAQGGVGVFIDTLHTYPYFIIPETTYGHLLFFNQNGLGFLDKTVSSQLSTLSLGQPALLARTSNDNLVVCSTNLSGCLYKMDHAGNILAQNDTSVVLSTNETPIGLLCDYDDNITLTTTLSTYVFDSLFTLIHSFANPVSENSATAFSYNSSTGDLSAVTVSNVLDLKFAGLSAWSIDAASGNLHINNIPLNTNTLLPNLTSSGLDASNLLGTNLQIDPNGNIWVLAGTNIVYVYNPHTPSSSYWFVVGEDYNHPQKQLSFINVYNRATATNEWVSVIYYSDEHYIFVNRLDGTPVNIIDVFPFVNFRNAQLLGENTDSYTFGAKGDFTGYDFKRVFNDLIYNNTKQIIIKAALRDKTNTGVKFKIFKSHIPVGDWNSNIWKNIALVYKNKSLTLYLDASATQATINWGLSGGRYDLYFENQSPFFFGIPVGVKLGLNREIGSTTSIFNGVFSDIQLLNYALDPSLFDTVLRSKLVAQDITWSSPIPSTSYVETIERMFKNKLPGSKSNFYNIKLAGTNITDPGTRAIIEQSLMDIIKETAPASSDLANIIWIS